MDTNRLRRELAASFRLFAREERRLYGALVALALVYPVWVAGTGVAVSRVATSALGPVTVDPWTHQTTAHVGLFAFLWVVLPAGAGAAVAVNELTNIRGNIRQCYRFGRPALLLVPPALGYVVVVATLRVGPAGIPTEYLVAALGVVSVVFLLRVVAYGYRVYALSIPRVLQTMLFAGMASLSVAGLSRSAGLAGQEAFVRKVATTAGASGFVHGTVTAGDVVAPTALALAIAAPTVLGVTYLVAQFLASLVVRVRKPDVSRASVRAGQRYPTFADAGADAVAQRGRKTDADTGGDGDADTDGDVGAADGTTAVGSDDSVSDADAPSAEVQSVGHTRVYSPPDEDDATGSVADDRTVTNDRPPVTDTGADDRSTQVDDPAVKNEMCPICGVTFAADPDR
ncbi:MAG: hypothetical protein ABEJ85_00430, partial [Haloarculaceae archaeon]